MNEKIRQLEQQLDSVNSPLQVDPRRQMELTIELAWELRHFDAHTALALSQTAYKLAQSKNDPTGQIDSLRNLVNLHTYFIPNHATALVLISKSLDLLRTCPNELIHAQILDCMSTIYRSVGDYPAAYNCMVQAMALCRQAGNQAIESFLHSNLGIIYLHLKDYDHCLEAYEQGLKIAQTIGDGQRQAQILNNIGDLLGRMNRYDEALPYLEQALTICGQLGHVSYKPTILASLGEVYAAQGNYEQALTYLDQACQIAETHNDNFELAEYLRLIAQVQQQQGNLDSALVYLARVMDTAEAVEFKLEMYNCHLLLAEIHEAQQQPERALFHYKQFFALKTEVFNEQSDLKLKTLQVIHQTETARQEAEIYRLKNIELQAALDQVKQLSGLLPICASCKKIRDDGGYWHDVAVYIRDHSEAEFSHGICPDCAEKLYPKYANLIKKS
jgi:tetratricopeptide (TPR) repeat protein